MMDQPLSVSHSAEQPPADTPKKRRHYWIWVLILLAFALLFFWVWHQKSGSTAGGPPGAGGGGGRGGRGGAFGGPVPVSTVTATKGGIGVYLDAIGTVTPLYMDSITSQVTGVITAVHYKEGQYVHKGDPLIDIDPRTYEAQLQQAQGALDRDQSLLAEAQMDLKRYQDAWARNAIPRQTLEDQEKQVLQVQGTVHNDEGNVQYDKVLVGFCHITSPIDGRVGLRLVDAGNLVTANSTTQLVVVASMQPITVVFTAAEDDLPQILQETRHGQTLGVLALDRTKANQLAKGKLTTIDNQIDTVTGTVKMRALFDNKDGSLFPNQFVNTRLLVKTLQNQILIPASAIQHNGSNDFVYVIKDGKAVMKTVKSGVSDQGNTAVTGIEAGDVVANSSFEKLVNGSQVYQSKVKIPNNPSGASEAGQ